MHSAVRIKCTVIANHVHSRCTSRRYFYIIISNPRFIARSKSCIIKTVTSQLFVRTRLLPSNAFEYHTTIWFFSAFVTSHNSFLIVIQFEYEIYRWSSNMGSSMYGIYSFKGFVFRKFLMWIMGFGFGQSDHLRSIRRQYVLSLSRLT